MRVDSNNRSHPYAANTAIRTGKKPVASGSTVRSQPFSEKTTGDTADISMAALLLNSVNETPQGETQETVNRQEKTEQREIDKLHDMEEWYRSMFEQLEAAHAQAKATGEGLREKMMCLEIAMRIISGDNVPKEDHQYLLKKDPGLYMRAISMRFQKEDPKDHDRLTEDEEDDGVKATGGDGTVSRASGTKSHNNSDSGGTSGDNASADAGVSAEASAE